MWQLPELGHRYTFYKRSAGTVVCLPLAALQSASAHYWKELLPPLPKAYSDLRLKGCTLQEGEGGAVTKPVSKIKLGGPLSPEFLVQNLKNKIVGAQ